MQQPETALDKIWRRHAIAEDAGQTLVFVDCHLMYEISRFAFDMLRARGLSVRRPEQTFAVPDHYVPTHGRRPQDYPDAERRDLVTLLERNARAHGISYFGVDDPRQGIVHVIGPELGLTLPGTVLVCPDSHTSTHGALGALAFGIGVTEASHVLATQSLWLKKPKAMRIAVTGRRPFGVSAKDIALSIIARIGAAGAVGHVIEYDGPIVRALSVEERLTLCNMAIEAGARTALITPDETTFAYVKGRPFAPQDADLERAVAYWRTLASDDGAVFDREAQVSASDIAPMVTWGTSPQDARAITGDVPDPRAEPNADRRRAMEQSLAYMDLAPGTRLADIAIDRVFIGSCTNSRIEDLRQAAAVAKGRRALVPTLVVPGSGQVKAQAEREGIDRIFLEAGFEWREAGCSMCVGNNGDIGRAGERCASTSNRNFAGRQGAGVRTHLMSPAMAAAAAVTGRLTDVRELRTDQHSQ